MEYGFISVLPPLITIILAFLTKNVFISLFLGLLLGNLVIFDMNIIAAINGSLNGIVAVFESRGNTIVILVLLLIGALIHIIEKSGGIEGFVKLMVEQKGIIKSKRAADIFTWLLGVAVFTSGSLSAMVAGSVSRPINNAMKVPHEKSSFIVHTTTTPVCVLIPLSGWGASMIGYLTSGGVPEAEATNILIKSISLNFYCLLVVFGALFIAISQKDFGPMKQAEIRAKETGQLDARSNENNNAEEIDTKSYIDAEKPLARNLFVPIGVLIAVIITVLIVTGEGSLIKGDGMTAILWGASVALFVSAILCISQKIYSLDEFMNQAFKGAGGMLSIAMVLVLGFTMGKIVGEIGTGPYLASIFDQFLNPALLPALVFVMAMIISFATGTSMGTMAITAVIALPMAYAMGVNIALVASAIWGGSIFGDHSSPISDTTIMSCATTGCDIMDHINSQLPYTLIAAGVTFILYIVFGFVM